VWLPVALTALAAVIAIAVHQTGVLDGIERASVDARFTLRGHERPPASIAIVALDNASLASLQLQPPIPRRYWARLIEILHGDGARLITFDIAFDTRNDAAHDEALWAAARRAAPILFGTALISSTGQTLVLGGPAVQHQVGARVGGTLLPVDPDGALRRVVYSVSRLPTLPVVAAQMLGRPVDRTSFGAGGALISYYGSPQTFATYSLSSVLSGAVPPSRFAGKTVLIGTSAPVLQDLHPTPFGTMPGVEIQANALATVLAGLPLRNPDLWLTVLTSILLAAVAPALAARLPVAAALGGSLVAAVLYAVAAQLAFSSGSVLDVPTPELAWGVSAVGTLLAAYLAVDRERDRLRVEFAAFRPELVQRVLRGDAVALPPTEVVAGYRLDEVIGRGGMAVVYRAIQLDLERTVALKLIAPSHADDPRFRARFLRESRLAATVEHPHVIPIFAAGEDDGLLFIAMRFIDGVDLGDVLERMAPLDPADAVRIVEQIAGALDAAHRAGLVHRDVKPSNILLDSELESAYLTDFGIAREFGHDATVTSSGAFVGSAAYAAPEQATGELIDGRTDIYALGAILYHALVGQPPYGEGGTMVATLFAHANAPVPTVSAVVPALSSFDPVIAHAMAKQPEDRFAAGCDLAAAARGALAEVVSARAERDEAEL
jgi:CHASE2 domain-containing sensor protein/predicted Ser/Thr protein kinase